MTIEHVKKKTEEEGKWEKMDPGWARLGKKMDQLVEYSLYIPVPEI